MEATNQQYSLFKKVKDDKFDVDHLENYRLTLHLGADSFQLSIFDVNSNKCLLLEDYFLHDVYSSENTIDILKDIFESHHLLKAGFWNDVKVSFKNKKFTTIPASLFNEGHARDYLRLSCEINPFTEEIDYFHHKSGNFVTVFAADKIIKDWITQIYPSVSVQVLHQSCAIIEGVLNYEKTNEGVFAYLNKNDLHIVVISEKRLVFNNIFSCNSKEDFLRYILIVFNELKLNQYTTPVTLWGSITEDSPYYQLLYQYIKHISFAKKPGYLKFDFQFDEVNDHEYLDVYSINLCN